MNKKEFVDKWVGKHGFAGIFHNYRKDCIQDLTNLLNNWISIENKNRRLITDIPSTSLFGNHGLKVCRCSNTEIRYRLYDNHTWEEVCIKCNAKSPQPPKKKA